MIPAVCKTCVTINMNLVKWPKSTRVLAQYLEHPTCVPEFIGLITIVAHIFLICHLSLSTKYNLSQLSLYFLEIMILIYRFLISCKNKQANEIFFTQQMVLKDEKRPRPSGWPRPSRWPLPSGKPRPSGLQHPSGWPRPSGLPSRLPRPSGRPSRRPRPSGRPSPAPTLRTPVSPAPPL